VALQVGDTAAASGSQLPRGLVEGITKTSMIECRLSLSFQIASQSAAKVRVPPILLKNNVLLAQKVPT